MAKEFNLWNNKKKALHEREFDAFVHEREVWWCALGINIGVEADGKHETFERPVLVLRKFNKDSVLVVCLSSRANPDNPYHIRYNHEGREFAAIISQVRLVSTKRLTRKVFAMGRYNFELIVDCITQMIRNKRPPRKRGPRRP